MIIRYPPIPPQPRLVTVQDDSGSGSEGESSTVTVRSQCARLRKTPLASPPQHSRRVRFDEEANQVHRTRISQSAPVFCCWYSEQEIDAFKRRAKKDAKQISTSDASEGGLYRQAVKRLLDHCQEAALTGSSPKSLSEDECQALQIHPELLGLERWMSRLRAEKHQQLDALHQILCQQTNPENIRWHCERLSLTSRLLAVHLAMIQCEE